MIDEIRELFAYTRWANRQILDAVAALDEEAYMRDLGCSFGSIHGTLAHIVGADWAWLQRWKGTSPRELPDDMDLSTLDAVRRTWDDIERERETFLAGLGDADLERTFDYRNMKGEPFRNTLGETLRHVVNHATYHRGQVVTMLRQVGASPPSTDMIRYYRERVGDGVRAGG